MKYILHPPREEKASLLTFESQEVS